AAPRRSRVTRLDLLGAELLRGAWLRLDAAVDERHPFRRRPELQAGQPARRCTEHRHRPHGAEDPRRRSAGHGGRRGDPRRAAQANVRSEAMSEITRRQLLAFFGAAAAAQATPALLRPLRPAAGLAEAA